MKRVMKLAVVLGVAAVIIAWQVMSYRTSTEDGSSGGLEPSGEVSAVVRGNGVEVVPETLSDAVTSSLDINVRPNIATFSLVDFMRATNNSASEIVDTLEPLARAGDASSACVIATILSKCAEGRKLREIAERTMDAAARSAQADVETVRGIAGMREAGEKAGRYCDGITESRMDERWRYLLQAAASGNPDSMFEYVVSPPIDLERPLEFAEAIYDFRRNALQFTELLVQNGSIEGLHLAFRLNAGDLYFGAQPIIGANPREALRFAATYSRYRKLSNREREMMRRLADEMPRADVTDAEMKGAQDVRKYDSVVTSGTGSVAEACMVRIGKK